jgi:hypothetical protein
VLQRLQKQLSDVTKPPVIEKKSGKEQRPQETLMLTLQYAGVCAGGTAFLIF